MLKQKSHCQHRRNHSELHGPTIQPQKQKKKLTSKGAKTSSGSQPLSTSKKTLNSHLVNSLIAKSIRKVHKKQVIIEDIQEEGLSKDNDQEGFFQFGKRVVKALPVDLLMQQIVEVPDTGSYTQRNTEERPKLRQSSIGQNKQNHINLSNCLGPNAVELLRFPVEKVENAKNKQAHSHRVLQNCSKRSRSKSTKSQNCSQSTVELRSKADKSKGKKKGKHSAKNQQVEGLSKQVKLIWQCLGDIWTRNKTTENKANENSQLIQELMRRNQLQEKELLQLKLVCTERGKPAGRWLS